MLKRACGISGSKKAVTHAWSPAGKAVILDETTGEIHDVIGLTACEKSAARHKNHGFLAGRSTL